MRLTVFLVCLFSLLVRGNAPVAADVHRENTVFLWAQHAGNLQLTDLNTQLLYRRAITYGHTDCAKECFISDEAEEENTDTNLAAKDKLQVSPFQLYSYPSTPLVLDYSRNYIKSPPYLFGKVSYKYLLLGVLRI